MTTMYKIMVTKETVVDLASEDEAKQIADILLSRENVANFAGHLTIAYSDYQKMEA